MADGMSKLRLDKYLADMGVGTRQEVKALVRKGRVAVDGITAKAPELKVCLLYTSPSPRDTR